jgi:hypothetical protein
VGLYLKKKQSLKKAGELAEWLKVKALSSNSSMAKKTTTEKTPKHL